MSATDGYSPEWTPGTPDRLTQDELGRYRTARIWAMVVEL